MSMAMSMVAFGESVDVDVAVGAFDPRVGAWAGPRRGRPPAGGPGSATRWTDQLQSTVFSVGVKATPMLPLGMQRLRTGGRRSHEAREGNEARSRWSTSTEKIKHVTYETQYESCKKL